MFETKNSHLKVELQSYDVLLCCTITLQSCSYTTNQWLKICQKSFSFWSKISSNIIFWKFSNLIGINYTKKKSHVCNSHQNNIFQK